MENVKYPVTGYVLTESHDFIYQSDNSQPMLDHVSIILTASIGTPMDMSSNDYWITGHTKFEFLDKMWTLSNAHFDMDNLIISAKAQYIKEESEPDES